MAYRRPRPFLCAPRCRGAEAVYPPPSARTGRSDTCVPDGGCVTLHAVGFAVPRLSPSGRCALTAPFHPCLIPGKAGAIGGLFSVALSLVRSECGRVGVTHHRVLSCSDFPPDWLPSRR